MGALLSILRPDASIAVTSDIFVDFENAKPAADDSVETGIYETISKDLQTGLQQHLKQLGNYRGCGDYIRKAISSPGPENELEAWKAVCPAVQQLTEFYEYSFVIEKSFLRLLEHICTLKQSTAETVALDVKSSLEKKQATASLLAKLLIFALDFDDLKMTNPNLQNDFSYYRRTLSRLKMASSSSPSNNKPSISNKQEMMDMAVVKDEMANKMSLFYAYPTPMLKCLVDSLIMGGLTSAGGALDPNRVSECFSIMAAVCHVAVENKRYSNDETRQFCLRVLVACIILYDHVHPKGAFAKGSDIRVKQHIKLIQLEAGDQSENLLNALRYTTKHLNDESTPKSIKSMLALNKD